MYSGSRRREVGARARRARRRPASRDDVRDEARVARRVLARDDDRLAHGGVLRERGLDLAELDAEAAHLHLVVDAAQALERAVARSQRATSPVR